MTEFIIYMIVTAVTPGPNCILLMSNASKKGFPKCLSLNAGMFVGIITVDSLAYFLISYLADLTPAVRTVLQIFGILYLLYLSWCLFRNGTVAIGDKEGGFRTGFLMQFVNVKVLMLGVTSISIYVLKMMKSPVHGYLLTMICPLICLLAGFVWSGAGLFLSKIYNRHSKVFNICFSLTLLYQAVKNAIALII